MKITKKIILLLVLVLCLSHIFEFCGPDIDEVREHYAALDKKHEDIITSLKTDVSYLKAENLALRDGKKQILERIDELLKKPVKEPGKVDTIIVDRVEYVPKIEYVKIYQLDIALKNALMEYINIDIAEQDTTDSIISKLEGVDKQREKQIKDLKDERDFYYKKAKKRSFLGIGVALAVTYDLVSNDFRYSIQAGVYYVFKIEIKLFK